MMGSSLHIPCIITFQLLVDLENSSMFTGDLECQKLLMEAMKYHLLPERQPMMQSPRTKPRKSTVGALYAVGGMDAMKGNIIGLESIIQKGIYILNTLQIMKVALKPYLNVCI